MNIFKHILWGTQAWVSIGSAGPKIVLILPPEVCVHSSCSTLGIIRLFHLSSLWEYNYYIIMVLIFISFWFWEPLKRPIAKLVSSFVNYLFKSSIFGRGKVRQNGWLDFHWFIVLYTFCIWVFCWRYIYISNIVNIYIFQISSPTVWLAFSFS